MTFLRLFQSELVHTWRSLLLLLVLSGVANAAVLATINQAAASAADSDRLVNAFLILGGVIVLYAVSQRALMLNASSLAEATVDNMRIRFVQSLQAAELIDVERLNRNEIYNCVTGEMQVISDGALNLIILAQSGVLVLVTIAYLA